MSGLCSERLNSYKEIEGKSSKSEGEDVARGSLSQLSGARPQASHELYTMTPIPSSLSPLTEVSTTTHMLANRISSEFSEKVEATTFSQAPL